jgi:hypothetical protein
VTPALAWPLLALAAALPGLLALPGPFFYMGDHSLVQENPFARGRLPRWSAFTTPYFNDFAPFHHLLIAAEALRRAGRTPGTPELPDAIEWMEHAAHLQLRNVAELRHDQDAARTHLEAARAALARIAPSSPLYARARRELAALE